MLSTYSIGVHFSKTHAFVICLDKDLFGIKVKADDCIDLSKNNTMAKRLENLGDYLTDFIDSKGLGEPEVYISFPGELSIVRQLTFPYSVKDDLASTLKYSLEKYVPLKADDLYFDFSILSEQKEKNIINILLASVRKNDLKPFVDLAGSMGPGVSGVQIDTLAVMNFIWHDVKQIIRTNPCLFILYCDGHTLDVICFKDGLYDYSRQIQVNEDENALLDLIKNELDHTKDKKSGDQVQTGIVACGSGIDQNIYQYLNSRPEFILKKYGFDKYNLPSEDFIPAFGLALNGLIRNLSVPINLLPANKRKKASKAANYIMYSLTFLAIILGIFWGIGYAMHQNMVNKNIDAKLVQLEKEVSAINLKKAEIRKIEMKIEAINRLSKEQVKIDRVLKELSDLIPQGSWLKSFSFKMGKGVRIMGESDAASDLIPLLESSSIFKNCVFQSAITKNNNGKERFSIGCDLVAEGLDK